MYFSHTSCVIMYRNNNPTDRNKIKTNIYKSTYTNLILLICNFIVVVFFFNLNTEKKKVLFYLHEIEIDKY